MDKRIKIEFTDNLNLNEVKENSDEEMYQAYLKENEDMYNTYLKENEDMYNSYVEECTEQYEYEESLTKVEDE